MVLKEKRQEVMGLISLFDMKGIEKKILLTPYRRRKIIWNLFDAKLVKSTHVAMFCRLFQVVFFYSGWVWIMHN